MTSCRVGSMWTIFFTDFESANASNREKFVYRVLKKLAWEYGS